MQSKFAFIQSIILPRKKGIGYMFIVFCVFFWFSVISNTEKYRVKPSWTINEKRKFYGIEFGF